MKSENYEKLKEYFLNLKKEDMLTSFSKNPFIPMEWVFTDLVLREDVEKAIIDFCAEKFPGMKKMTKVDGFEIWKNKGRISFKVREIGNNLKCEFTDDKGLAEEEDRIFQFNELVPSLRKILGIENLDEKSSKLIDVGVKKAFDDAAENLLEYYKYMLEEKEKHTVFEGAIKQRVDEGKKNKHPKPRIDKERKNPLIDFQKRKEFLENQKPKYKIKIFEKDEKGITVPGYFVCVYNDGLLQDIGKKDDGYLFIAEPIEPDRRTRVFYLSKEEFEKIKEGNDGDKCLKIAEEYLSMSTNEFESQKKGTIPIVHTEEEAYKERILFYKNATKAKSLTNLKASKKYLEKLYGRSITLPYYTPKTGSDIGKIGAQAKGVDSSYNGPDKDGHNNEDKR